MDAATLARVFNHAPPVVGAAAGHDLRLLPVRNAVYEAVLGDVEHAVKKVSA